MKYIYFLMELPKCVQIYGSFWIKEMVQSFFRNSFITFQVKNASDVHTVTEDSSEMRLISRNMFGFMKASSPSSALYVHMHVAVETI